MNQLFLTCFTNTLIVNDKTLSKCILFGDFHYSHRVNYLWNYTTFTRLIYRQCNNTKNLRGFNKASNVDTGYRICQNNTRTKNSFSLSPKYSLLSMKWNKLHKIAIDTLIWLMIGDGDNVWEIKSKSFPISALWMCCPMSRNNKYMK